MECVQHFQIESVNATILHYSKYNNTIVIKDAISYPFIYIYSLDGKLLNKIECDNKLGWRDMISSNDETLLALTSFRHNISIYDQRTWIEIASCDLLDTINPKDAEVY